MVPSWERKRNCQFYCLPVFGQKFCQLNIKAVHNLKAKSSGIILTPWAVCADFRISTIFGL